MVTQNVIGRKKNVKSQRNGKEHRPKADAQKNQVFLIKRSWQLGQVIRRVPLPFGTRTCVLQDGQRK